MKDFNNWKYEMLKHPETEVIVLNIERELKFNNLKQEIRNELKSALEDYIKSYNDSKKSAKEIWIEYCTDIPEYWKQGKLSI